MLIYSTCTLRREENRDVADKALTWPIHQGEGTQTEGPLLEPWAFDEDWALDLKMRGGGPHMLELLPHVHKSDGFFIARFRRRQHTTDPMT
jgi:16S rRNA C967 or C1407 C5-methylase (RsmB/RsmF family)